MPIRESKYFAANQCNWEKRRVLGLEMENRGKGGGKGGGVRKMTAKGEMSGNVRKLPRLAVAFVIRLFSAN